MRTLIYNDVTEDIKKRMNDFDSKRFVKNIDFQKSNIILDVDFKKDDNLEFSALQNNLKFIEDVVKVEPIIMAKPGESSFFEVKKEEINVAKDKTKENTQTVKNLLQDYLNQY